jgi:hypothetical protein
VRYVDAGYAVALGTMFVYAIALGLRRRRWERALKAAETADAAAPGDATTGAVAPGGRS